MTHLWICSFSLYRAYVNSMSWSQCLAPVSLPFISQLNEKCGFIYGDVTLRLLKEGRKIYLVPHTNNPDYFSEFVKSAEPKLDWYCHPPTLYHKGGCHLLCDFLCRLDHSLFAVYDAINPVQAEIAHMLSASAKLKEIAFRTVFGAPKTKDGSVTKLNKCM